MHQVQASSSVANSYKVLDLIVTLARTVLISGMEEKLKEFLIEVGMAVSKRCFNAFTSDLDLNKKVKTTPADIIYRVDIEAEEEIESLMEERAGEFGGIILLAEGIGENDLEMER